MKAQLLHIKEEGLLVYGQPKQTSLAFNISHSATSSKALWVKSASSLMILSHSATISSEAALDLIFAAIFKDAYFPFNSFSGADNFFSAALALNMGAHNFMLTSLV